MARSRTAAFQQEVQRLYDLERFEALGQLDLLPTPERMASRADLERLRGRFGLVEVERQADDAPSAISAMDNPAAKAARTSAMYALAVELLQRDPDAALTWYQRAAEAGHADAMHELGALLSESDPDTAQAWYQRAAEAGHVDAMYQLGVLLSESNRAATRAWYTRAAGAGHSDAMIKLAELLFTYDDDTDAARSWLERAAVESGDTHAMVCLGALLADPDPHAARSWLERAATAGDAAAMYDLGILLADRDPDIGFTWFERRCGWAHGRRVRARGAARRP